MEKEKVKLEIEVKKATATGFCFGVKRAIETLENAAAERGQVEALGAIVHNQQVLQRMADIGVRVTTSLDDIRGDTVAIGAHGVSPQLEAEIRARYSDVIDTTCPFVHRAQIAAGKMARAGFHVIVYGDVGHPEVKGILGWANNNGIATLDVSLITAMEPLPRRVGVLSQTTQIPARFTEFAKKIVDVALVKDAEVRIADTICHDIRERQRAALDLARQVDLMLVIGSPTSANTKHLAELCSTVTETHAIENAAEIQLSWIKGLRIGVTGGASTAEEAIDEVIENLANF